MKSIGSQEAPTNEAAPDFEKCFVDLGKAFIPNSQTAKLMQPSNGSLYHPAGHA
jgi:hypothetical protein